MFHTFSIPEEPKENIDTSARISEFMNFFDPNYSNWILPISSIIYDCDKLQITDGGIVFNGV